MKKIDLTLEEQETTYNLYPRRANQPCEIYTSVPKEIEQIRQYAAKYPDEIKITQEDEIGIFAEAPRDWFKFRPPVHRTMPEEQKQALRDRLAALRLK